MNTGIVDEGLVSVRTSAGTEMVFKSRDIELNGHRPRISHGTNVQARREQSFCHIENSRGSDQKEKRRAPRSGRYPARNPPAFGFTVIVLDTHDHPVLNPV